MEKFSLYDLLGLLLSGVLFVYFCNVLNSVFGVFPLFDTSIGWNIDIGILLCFALIAGAMLYAINFWLIKKRWYDWLFGMKKQVAELYLELNVPHLPMNQTLNRKALEWYGNNIFFSKEELKHRGAQLTDHERNLQDEFYDRMYYELQYLDKIDSAKTLQRFYYFFRQTVTAFLLLLILFIVLTIFGLAKGTSIPPTKADYIIWIPILLLLTTILSAGHAQWFRKSMILKMYWAYFSHLNQPLNK